MLRKILLAACIVLVFLVVTETVLTFCVLFSADGLSVSFLYEKTLVFPFPLLVKDRVKSVGNKVSFGHDENGDALQWVICDVQKDGCLLPAAKPVGTRPNDNAGETKWSKTSLQKRLNGDFFDTSFTDEEKACMVRETVTVKTRDWTWTTAADGCTCPVRLLTHEEAKAAKKTLLRFESPYWIITPDFGHVSNAMYVEADGQIINRDFNYGNPFVSAGRDDVAIRPVIKVSEIKT